MIFHYRKNKIDNSQTVFVITSKEDKPQATMLTDSVISYGKDKENVFFTNQYLKNKIAQA